MLGIKPRFLALAYKASHDLADFFHSFCAIFPSFAQSVAAPAFLFLKYSLCLNALPCLIKPDKLIYPPSLSLKTTSSMQPSLTLPGKLRFIFSKLSLYLVHISTRAVSLLTGLFSRLSLITRIVSSLKTGLCLFILVSPAGPEEVFNKCSLNEYINFKKSFCLHKYK